MNVEGKANHVPKEVFGKNGEEAIVSIVSGGQVPPFPMDEADFPIISTIHVA